LFVRSFVRSFGGEGKEEEERRGENDEGKKVMTKGKRSKEKGLVGKSHTYRYFSISAVPRFKAHE
jgi:hypothetical protein